MRKRGYVNTIGYVLILENGDTMQFSTEGEADEYIKEKEKENESKVESSSNGSVR